MNNNEFLNQVKTKLTGYHEKYQEGSWEAFNQRRKKRRPIGIYWVSAAASVLLVMGYLGINRFVGGNVKQDHPQGKNVPKVIKMGVPGRTGLQEVAPGAHPSLVTLPGKIRVPGKAPILSTVASERAPVQQQADLPEVVMVTHLIIYENLQPGKIVSLAIPKNNKHPTPAFSSLSLLKEPGFTGNEKNGMADSSRHQKLAYSIGLSPGIGNKGMNVQASLGLQYAISRNMSVRTGIGISAINAGKQAERDRVNSVKTLENIQFNVSGIEVPLAVAFNPGKKWNASVGISGMKVIKEARRYHYVTEKTDIITVMSGGQPVQRVVTTLEKSTERTRVEPVGYAGFFTLSAGTSQPLGKRKLLVEPFLKLPFKAYSAENIQLTHGGVKLSLAF